MEIIYEDDLFDEEGLQLMMHCSPVPAFGESEQNFGVGSFEPHESTTLQARQKLKSVCVCASLT